ncbi:MAG: DUF4870 domain-containing protein [Acidobacteriota bacterium]|nr:DUF4870 domain-containing protein [Acidobacteriota bacterium]
MYTVSKDERTWGMLAHLSALLGYLILPFGNIIAPLVIWLMKKDQSQFVADQAKESLNFQISLMIYAVISGILILVVIGLFLLIALYFFGIVMTLIGTVKANSGEGYRYPLTIRLIN